MEQLVRAVQDVPWPKCVGVEVVDLPEARTVPQFDVAERAYRAWWSINPGRVPSQHQLDPLSFGAALLPHLGIIDRLQDGLDYRWRLAGEQANLAMGLSLRGRHLSEIEALQPDQTLYRGLLDQVSRACEPLFYVIRYGTVSGCRKRAYGVLLPLQTICHGIAGGHRPVGSILSACSTTTGS